MLATDADLARGGPRRGARVVRCERVSRTVRAYSKNLIVSGESWAADIPGRWEAWDRTIPKGRRDDGSRPKLSATWRRRMAIKEVAPLPRAASMPMDMSRKISYGRAKRPGQKDERARSAHGDDEARWGSLAGKEWSLFEEGGFDTQVLSGVEADDMRTRLQFDLSESAKIVSSKVEPAGATADGPQSVSEARQTMDWTDFASPSGGFNRTDPLLDVSLAFAAPIKMSITEWPREREELQQRLHKTQKNSTPFAYDTTPRIGADVVLDDGSRSDSKGRVYVEEAFLDCWADLMMGAGWLDREELTFKEANWAIVCHMPDCGIVLILDGQIEYKALPSRPESPPLGDPLADPRTTEVYFLFEECVPLDYQLAVADPKQKRTFAGLFSPKKSKRNAVAPRVASGLEDADFDRMLLHRQKTKKLMLNGADAPQATVWHMSADLGSPLKSPTRRPRTQSNGHANRTSDASLEGKPGFFSRNKERVIRRVKTDEEQHARLRREKEQEVDFELRTASGVSSGNNSPEEVGRRQKSEDKWIGMSHLALCT